MSGENGHTESARGGEPLRIERVPIASLHADPSNVNTHPDDNLAAIAGSLRQFGQVEPLVVQRSTGKVIGGNGRLAVMAKSGATEVDVVRLDIDDTRAAALGIALNRTAKTSVFDDGALAKLLESLPKDLQESAGYTEKDMGELLDSLRSGEVVEDEAPAPLPEPVSRRGDLWLLGAHRLLCGDSTDGGDVALCLQNETASVCLTDPPYGCGEAYVSHDDSQENLRNLVDGFFVHARERCTVVAMTPGINNMSLYPKPDWVLCWFYGVGTGRTPWGFSCWQPVMVYGKDPMLARGLGCHPDGVNMLMSKDDAKQSKESGHACPKPLSVWAWFLERVAPERNATIYEPFSGSGTTIVAAEQLGRRCFAIEIEPRYVDVAVRRWQKLTGKDATHAETGKTWKDTAAERGVKIES